MKITNHIITPTGMNASGRSLAFHHLPIVSKELAKASGVSRLFHSVLSRLMESLLVCLLY